MAVRRRPAELVRFGHGVRATPLAVAKERRRPLLFCRDRRISMKRLLYGTAALAVIALAPAVASAQYYGYYPPQPYYGAPVYPAYSSYPAYPGGFPAYNVPPGYVAPSAPGAVNYGQASASSH